MQNKIIIGSTFGQLGNRLLLFSRIIAFGAEHRVPVLNPAFYEYSPYFEGSSIGCICQYPQPRSGVRSYFIRRKISKAVLSLLRLCGRQKIGHWFYARISDDARAEDRCVVALNTPAHIEMITRTKRTVIDGFYYENDLLLHKHADAIRAYFRPITPHRLASEALLARVREKHDHAIGVHIRHGDYKEWQGGAFFLETADYAGFMRVKCDELRKQGKSPAFVVCSNEVQDAADFGDLPVFFATGQFIEDLHSLSLCDEIMAVPSTFSSWASFYGNIPLQRLAKSPAQHPQDI